MLILPPVNQITEENLEDNWKKLKIYYGGETTFAKIKERLAKYMNRKTGVQLIPEDLHLWKPEFSFSLKGKLQRRILEAKAELDSNKVSETRNFPGISIDDYSRELVSTY